MTIADVFKLAEQFVTDLLRKEVVAQGHHLTGELEASIKATVSASGDTYHMEGFALFYTDFLERGFPATSASNDQAPFLIEFFLKRGLQEEEAVAAAFATIKVWQRDGMPTQASKRFSKTGSRTDYVENTFVGHRAEIDTFVSQQLDKLVDEMFHREKSETI